MKLFSFFRRAKRTIEEKKNVRKERMLLAASGLMLAAGFPPSPFPMLLLVGLIPFFFVITRRKGLLQLNYAAYLMSFVFSVAALYWVGAFTQAKDPYLMGGGLALFFINPLAFLVPTTLYHFSRRYISPRIGLFLFPFFWVFYEYLYTLTDWSFPWLNLGNGISDFNLFIQIADLIGVFGLSLIIVSINLLLYLAVEFRKEKRRSAVVYVSAAFLLFVVVISYGAFSKIQMDQGSGMKVGIVQPNLDPYDKWAGTNVEDILNDYLSESRKLAAAKVDLFIWPETALPVYYLAPPYARLRDRVDSFINETGIPLLTGMPDIRYYTGSEKKPKDVKYSKSAQFYYANYNAIYLIQPGNKEIQRYGKNKLVPFGERVPFVDQIPVLGDIMRWSVGIGGWNVGQDTANFAMPLRNGKVSLCGMVCYESIYSNHVADMVRRGAELLVLVTNDSWYGNTSGPYQHRDFAKLRAVETRRYIVRCANGGISCTIDETGNIVSQTKMYEKTVYSETVKPLYGQTFYVRHAALIPVLTTVISLLSLLAALVLKFLKR